MPHITIEITKTKKGRFIKRCYDEGKTQTEKLNELIEDYLSVQGKKRVEK